MWQAEKVKEDAVIFTWMKVISVLVNSYILLCLSSFVSFMSPFSSSCEAFRSSASFSPATRSETSRSPEPCWPPAPAITTRTDTRPWWVQEQHFCVIVEVESVCFSPAGASRLSHSAVVFPPAPYHRRPDNITIFPFCNLVAWRYAPLLQSSSKPFPPPSSSSSLSRFLQPLKVVNRKRPPRDDWNNYSSQGDHEGDGPSQEMDQDTCIKVRQTIVSSSVRYQLAESR